MDKRKVRPESRSPKVAQRCLPRENGSPRKRLTRAGAITISTLLHVAVAFVVLGVAAGSPVSGGGELLGDNGPVFEVQLMPRSVPPPATATSDPGLTPLIAKLRDAPPEKAILVSQGAKSRPMAALFNRLHQKDEEEEAEPEPSPTDAPEQAAKAVNASRGKPSSVERPVPGPPVNGDSTGALWGRIEPCWRKGSYHSQLPVTLEVSLDDRGQLSRPPRILRADDAAPNERRLASEERAIASLAACLPRGEPRFKNAVYKLHFDVAK